MRNTSQPLLLAHRGYCETEPENSLSAFRAAIAAGFDGVECDLRVTRDRAVVITHDATLDRTTTHSGKVSDLSLSEVQEAALHLPQANIDNSPKQSIPTLESMIEVTSPLALINLEIKADIREFSAITKAIEKALNQKRITPEQIVISSFNPAIIRASKEQLRNIETALLLEDVPKDLASTLEETQADILSPAIDLIDSIWDHIAPIKPIRLWAWSAKAPEELQRLCTDARLEAIISDCSAKV